MKEKSKITDLKEDKVLCPEEKNILHMQFYDTCSNIFNMIEEGKITGVLINHGYYATANEIDRYRFCRLTGHFSDELLVLAKKEEDGKIRLGEGVTIEDEFEFLNSVANRYEKEISNKIEEINQKYDRVLRLIKK